MRIDFIDLLLIVIVTLGGVSLLHESSEMDLRRQQQGDILQAIEAHHSPATSHLVELWRSTHLQPTADDVTSLKILSERIKGDPSLAAQACLPLEAQLAQERRQEIADNARQHDREKALADDPWGTVLHDPMAWLSLVSGLMVIVVLYRIMRQRALGI